MKGSVLFTGMLSALLAACSTTAATPTATLTPTAILTVATAAPTVVPTSTPPQVSLRVKDELVNCRFGPGTNYVLVNELRRNQSARVVGRNESSTWLYIRDPGNPGGFCWVSQNVTEAEGALDELPVKPPPFVTVTDVSLRAEPNRILVNCDQFPQTIFFEAQVTANGPTLLTWRWEASTGVVSNNGTLVFEEAGTQVINDYYQVGAPNEYWVKLHILTPNERVEQVNFPVSCTP
jgi:SH3-like domain-containing protein